MSLSRIPTSKTTTSSILILLMLVVLATFAYADTILLNDEFTGTSLDFTKWHTSNATIIVNGGGVFIGGATTPYPYIMSKLNFTIADYTNLLYIINTTRLSSDGVGNAFPIIANRNESSYAYHYDNIVFYGSNKMFTARDILVTSSIAATENLGEGNDINTFYLKWNSTKYYVRSSGDFGTTYETTTVEKWVMPSVTSIQAAGTGNINVSNIIVCDDTDNDWSCTIPATTPPNISISSPTNNTNIYRTKAFWLNATCNDTTGLVSNWLNITNSSGTIYSNHSSAVNISLNYSVPGVYNITYTCKNTGGVTISSFITFNITQANVTFLAVSPQNLTIYTTLTQKTYINYSVKQQQSDASINLLLNYNSTKQCFYKFQGTCLKTANTFYPFNYTTKFTSDIFGFTFQEEELTHENTMVNMSRVTAGLGYLQTLNMSNEGHSIKVSVLNLLTDNKSSLLAFNFNTTATSGTNKIYFCNSSYSTGDYRTSSNCFDMYTFSFNENYSYTDTYGIYTSYYIIAPYNITNLRIGSVNITNPSYFVFDKVTANGENRYYFDPNQSYNTALTTSTNNGGAWTNRTGLMDWHIHNYNIDSICYKLQVDGFNDSALTCNLLDIFNIPPSNVEITSPTNATFTNSYIWINYTNATDFQGPISYYSINLNNKDRTFNQTIIANNSLNTSYYWDILAASIPDGNYTVSVKAYDLQGVSSTSYSQIFIIDKLSPYIFWTTPSPSILTTISLGESMVLDSTFYDLNLYAYEIVVYSPLGNVLFQNNLTGLSYPYFNFLALITPTEVGIHTIYLNVSDSHTKRKFKDMPNVATPTGMIFYNDEYNQNKQLKRSATKIDYSSAIPLNSIETIKKEDRYNFKLTLKNKPGVNDNNYITFTVNCSGLDYVENSPYTAHFVCKRDRLWIDFMNPNIISYTISDCLNVSTDCKKVELYIKLNDTLTFESIGGLNFNTSTITFNVTAPSSTNESTNTTLSFFTCPSTTQGMMSMMLGFVVIAFFLVLALWGGIIVIGWAASIMGMFWFVYFAGCSMLIAIFGCFIMIIMLLYFIVQGLTNRP